MTSRFAAEVDAVRRGERDVDAAVARLLGALTDPELRWLLDGDTPLLTGIRQAGRFNAEPFPAGRIDRLGIPGIRFTDGPRGVVLGASTSFPVPIARAASWDPDLERAVGDAIGAEARAQGANLFAGICVNLSYAPGWGRSQESYGEDPLLLGAMGAALSRGAGPWVMTCVKHFACNSMEERRFQVDVSVAEDTLREVYLPHFRAVTDAGVDAVMTAYNSVNGEWAGQNRHLITEILRQEWGFAGFVMTDFVWGLRDPVGSVRAGQDLEMPFRQQRAATLPAALADGRLTRAELQSCAARLLAAQIRFALRARAEPPAEIVACRAHRRLAREVAGRGMVLLRNAATAGSVALPLDVNGIQLLAVLGPLAGEPNQGDVGSSRVFPPETVSVLAGLRARLGDRVHHAETPAQARGADAAVVVVGLSSRDEGEALVGVDAESVRLFGGIARIRPVAAMLGMLLRLGARRRNWGGDRRDLRLNAADVALISQVAQANPRTVVVVIGGGTIVVEPWDSRVAAVLLAWYPGMEGGHAVADVLFGDAEPGGRLPMAIPRRAADLPVLDWDATAVRYNRWWGQRKLDRDGVAAAYPLGFGLGYTTFTIDALTVGPVDGEGFTATVPVTNTGSRPGRHVVQIYALRPADTGRTVHHLVGFRSVAVNPGSSVTVDVPCSIRPLQRWDGTRLVLDPATVTLAAGAFCGDPAAATAALDLSR